LSESHSLKYEHVDSKEDLTICECTTGRCLQVYFSKCNYLFVVHILKYTCMPFTKRVI